MPTAENRIWIPGNVPSLKNSKIIAGIGARCPKCKKAKHNTLLPSKTCKNYIKASKPDWLKNKALFLSLIAYTEPPYRVQFTFVRKTRHRFDYSNALEICQDLMTEYGWIEDDNSDILLPSFGVYSYNKDNPGVEIQVLF